MLRQAQEAAADKEDLKKLEQVMPPTRTLSLSPTLTLSRTLTLSLSLTLSLTLTLTLTLSSSR